MAQHEFDLVVVGGGPGGYVAAIRAAQLKMKVAVVESEHLGGICLNWGCIPTKALLRAAEIYGLMHHLGDFGFKAEGIGYDFDKVIKRSRDVAAQLSRGVAHLLKKNKVAGVRGPRPARRQQDGRGRAATARTPRASRPCTSSSPPARGRARCRASSRTASTSGPTRRPWSRSRCRNRSSWSARARSAPSSRASTTISAPTSRSSRSSIACCRSRTRRSRPSPASSSRSAA